MLDATSVDSAQTRIDARAFDARIYEGDAGPGVEDSSVPLDAPVTHTGAIYYISVDGSDAEDGSEERPFATFERAFEAMDGGDMLVIEDGTYAQNLGNWRWSGGVQVDEGPPVPSGSAERPTIIRSRRDGGVVITGEPSANGALHLSGGYIQLEGMTFVSTRTGESLALLSGHDLVVRRVGFGAPTDNDENIIIAGGEDILLEDCWAWGSGRSGVFAGGLRITLRRMVIRLDSYSGGHEMLGVLIYYGREILIENVIVLDFLTTDSGFEYKGGIRSREGYDAYGHEVFGSLVLNNPYHGFLMARMNCTNCVAWDVGGAHFREFSFSDEHALTHVTAGGNGGGLVTSGVSRADVLEGSAANALDHIVDGEGQGAAVLNRYQDGVETDEALWPWPNEARIRRDLTSHGGIQPTRGFASGEPALHGGETTLTSYIWEYNGQPCPAHICTR